MKPQCLLLPIILLLPLSGQGENWTQFRGPNGSGYRLQATLPIQLNTQSALAWKIALPGRGLSCPLIIGDRVFVTSASGPHQRQLHLLCFRAQDGTNLWERRFWATGRTMTHPKTCVAAPTPVSDGRRLFAIFSSNDLFCLDLDGHLLWLRGLTLDYPNASSSLGLASSPTLAHNVLVLQVEADSDSFAAGLDTDTGVNRWKRERRRVGNWTSPIVLPDSPSSSCAVVLQSSTGLDALDPATGTSLWSYTNGASTIASSVAAGPVLYAPSHGITALRPPQTGDRPEQIWRSSQLRPDAASPVVFQGKIYVLNSAGILSCGNAATGARLWQLRLQGPFSASPVLASQHLYCVNEKGLVHVVDLTRPEEGRLASTLDLGETILSTPSIGPDALYLRSDRHLWKFASRPSSL